MKTKKRYVKYVVIGIIATIIATYLSSGHKKKGHPRDYKEIRKEGILRVVTEYNSLNYYVDKDTVSGFHYDLICAFAKSRHLKVKITPEMSFEKQMEGLSSGKYDLIACGISVTSELKDSILLTKPIILNKQVLVQRKEKEHSNIYIRSQLDLANKKLHVVKGSPAILRIRNLSNEIGDTVYVEEIEKYGSEQLLAMVAHGDINYAVCDESTAHELINSFPQLDTKTAISFTQFYSWGVSKKSPVLLQTLNLWLTSFLKSDEYKRIYKKYYKD